MSQDKPPVAVVVADVAGIRGRTQYPAEFKHVVAGRTKQVLGNIFGLTGFGVNMTRLEPGAWSALRHWHTKEDEMIYMIEGELVLITDAGETILKPGMAAGFKAGVPNGHHLVNRSDQDAVFLEIGDRCDGEEGFYPDVDMKFRHVGTGAVFMHKDGTPY